MSVNINDLTYGQLKEIAAMFSNQPATIAQSQQLDNKMIGKYVIVRCRDAGVHAGYLESYNGRECVLTESRRMWYWKPADGQKYLSGMALVGAASDSKIAAPLPRIHLTENCEIIQCTEQSRDSIVGAKVDEK